MKNVRFLLIAILVSIPVSILQAGVINAGYEEIDYAIVDSIVISGNGTTVKLIPGGSISGNVSVASGANSFFVMTGGSIGGNIVASGAMPMVINGGTIGGNISAASPSALGNIYINGYDFMINGLPVAYGMPIKQNGHLTGTLENGDSIDTTLSFTGKNGVVFVEVPEPASLVLLTIGAMCLRRKKA